MNGGSRASTPTLPPSPVAARYNQARVVGSARPLGGGRWGTGEWGFGATKGSWPPRGRGVRPARLWEACCCHEEKRQAKLVALPPAHERLKATELRGAGPRRQRRGGVATCGGWWAERTSDRRIEQLMIKTQNKWRIYIGNAISLWSCPCEQLRTKSKMNFSSSSY